MIRKEKLCEGNLSTSLLEGSIGSDAAQTFIVDRKLFQIATTVQRKLQIDGMEVFGLSLFPLQKKSGRYVTGRLQSHASLFVGLVLAWTTSPPAVTV